jgi:hypothetical protein
MLMGAVEHDGDAQRPFFGFSRFWNVYSSDRLGLPVSYSFRVQWVNHFQPLFRVDRFDSIYPCGFLASVILRHPPYSYQSR